MTLLHFLFRYFTDNFPEITANGPDLADPEHRHLDVFGVVLVLLGHFQALLVRVVFTVHVGVCEY